MAACAGGGIQQLRRLVPASETPLEHTYSLVADIWGRGVKLAPYGLAFTKMAARRMGMNPIWYIDTTPGRDWTLAKALSTLTEHAIQSGNFHEQEIANLTPFCEQMGTWKERRKEFWWEREWRRVHSLWLPPDEGIIWLCPEGEMETLSVWGKAPVIDPRWGLEQIIANLAGFAPRDVTPFD